MNPKFYLLIGGLIIANLIFAQNESEPNNLFNDANKLTLNDDLSISVQGTIDPDSDYDYYRVEVPRAGVFVANVTNVPSEIEMDITLYDAGQNEIESRNEDSGRPVNLTQLVCEAGIYYFRLSDVRGITGNDSSPDLYNFTVTFDTSDVYECNNTFASATSINVCDTIKATINSVGDEDYYIFNSTDNQGIAINLSNIADNITPRISIFDESQNQITTQTGEAGRNLTYNFFSPSTGAFYLKVEELGDNSSSSQLYSLLLIDNSCAITSAKSTAYDEAILIYPNPTNDAVKIEFKNKSLYYNTYLQIFDSVGREIASHYNIEESNLIDISEFPTGLLIFKIQNRNMTLTKRILKK